jgi:hypothetical protein
MPLTKTGICNLALARIGCPAVSDVDTSAEAGTKSALACLTAFDQVVKEVARAGRWNCLKKRTTLDQIQDAPTYGAPPEFQWDYSYELPENCVRVIQVNGVDCGADGESDFYEIEGRRLLTDAEIVELQYISIDDCYDSWDPMFVDCVVVLLASKISFEILQDGNRGDALRSEYERVTLPRARSRNGNERHPRLRIPIGSSLFLRSRRSSTLG